MATRRSPSNAMSPEDQTFFVDLGRRIADARRDHGITQVQLAEILGVSQQQMLSFEKGRRRVPVSALPQLADTLGVTAEHLLGTDTKSGKRGPTPKIQEQLERLSRLPRSKQKFVTEMIDTVLQQAGR